MFLGIDGGQTKTAGVIIDRDGNVVAEKYVEGMYHMGELDPDSQRVFNQLAVDLCKEALVYVEDIEACGVGACGIDFAEQIPEKHQIFSDILFVPPENLVLVNDALVALWGATSGEGALIIQHGTAFTSAVRESWDNAYVFDSTDIGRLFDIRYELLVKVARMIDGRLPATGIKDRLLEFFNLNDESLFGPYIDHEIITAEQQLNTAPLIFNAWEEGDSCAAELIDCAIEDYVLMVKIMMDKIRTKKIDVIFSGGLLERAPNSFINLCAEKIQAINPDADVKRPILPPVYGAAVMAAAHAGMDPVKFFDAVKNSIKTSG